MLWLLDPTMYMKSDPKLAYLFSKTDLGTNHLQWSSVCDCRKDWWGQFTAAFMRDRSLSGNFKHWEASQKTTAIDQPKLKTARSGVKRTQSGNIWLMMVYIYLLVTHLYSNDYHMACHCPFNIISFRISWKAYSIFCLYYLKDCFGFCFLFINYND